MDIKPIKEIASGSYGRVEQKMIGDKQYAVKTNMRDTMNFTSAVCELDVLTQLGDHPHIVRLCYFVRHDDAHQNKKDDPIQFVLELGEDTLEHFHVSNTSDYQKAKLYMMQLLLAIEYIHGRGYMHRDIKPNNIILVKDNVKLCDFGLSVPVSGQGYRAKDVFTLSYGPPESRAQRTHNRRLHYDLSADMWSIGCIMYEMVTDKPLVDTVARNNLMAHVERKLITLADYTKHKTIEMFDAVFGGTFFQFIDMLRALLDKDPAARPSATELLNGPFFESGRAYINQVRERYPPYPPPISLPTLIKDKRRATLKDMAIAMHTKFSSENSNGWYWPRGLFLGIDIFERYLEWANRIPLVLSVSDINTQNKILICLYMGIKYFTDVVVPPPIAEIARKMGYPIGPKGLEPMAAFEMHLLFNVLRCTIYRRTIYDIADDYNVQLDDNGVRQLLNWYFELKPGSSIKESIKQFYFQIDQLRHSNKLNNGRYTSSVLVDIK